MKKTSRELVFILACTSMIAGPFLTGRAQAQSFWAMQSSGGPSPRAEISMVYDSCRGVTVMFGGSDMSGTLQDTWEWDGNLWALRAITGPTAHSGYAMAFDSNRCVTVLFGGNGPASFLNETWEWDGTSWTQKFPASSPPTRHGAGMTYDSTRGAVLLFGGYAPGLLNDTWEWDGTNWAQVSTTASPSPRSWVAMAFNPGSNRTIVFGGSTGASLCGPNTNETWELDMSTSPATWTQVTTTTQPSPRHRSRMVYDSARSVMVLFGGTDNCTNVFGDTWEYSGSTWSQIATPMSPAPRHFLALSYDSTKEEVLLFGGTTNPLSPLDSSEILGDTWSYGSRAGIPTISEWGLVVLTLLCMIMGTVALAWRRRGGATQVA